jgi:Fic-DOC domain mobile mystery protein B
MTDPLVPLGDGRTLLSDDDRQGLIPTYVATRGDLFDAEQRNISRALRRRQPTVDEILDDHYLRQLHRAMFGEVWEWAGRYRLTETNLGIGPVGIPPAVRNHVADAKAWVQHRTYDRDELAVRFHHRLVSIHPFPNGNGRHARVVADYLVMALGGDSFAWGGRLDVDTEALRQAYRVALQRADNGDLERLVAFARS